MVKTIQKTKEPFRTQHYKLDRSWTTHHTSNGEFSLVLHVIQVGDKVPRGWLVAATSYDVRATAALPVHLVTVMIIGTAGVTVTRPAAVYLVTHTPIVILVTIIETTFKSSQTRHGVWCQDNMDAMFHED